ncbi:hypothetical protein P2L35_13975 [Enterococcus faecium]|uniref:hypothetical protein n=1 Tax=Enterococcus faecium TaxID=1352 RepID=UPI0025B07E44|nr:hypothetical protein [Enterococcus faecium]MDN3040805.1 hypothetical protein [Enterococcus faecium]
MPNSKLPELIKLFLEINPTPSDEQFHNLAFSVGTDPETLESYAYQMLSEAEGAGLGHEMHPATAGTGDATKRSIDQRVLDGSMPPEAGGLKGLLLNDGVPGLEIGVDGENDEAEQMTTAAAQRLSSFDE